MAVTATSESAARTPPVAMNATAPEGFVAVAGGCGGMVAAASVVAGVVVGNEIARVVDSGSDETSGSDMVVRLMVGTVEASVADVIATVVVVADVDAADVRVLVLVPVKVGELGRVSAGDTQRVGRLFLPTSRWGSRPWWSRHAAASERQA